MESPKKATGCQSGRTSELLVCKGPSTLTLTRFGWSGDVLRHSNFGQPHAASRALHQRDAGGALQFQHMLADGRLGQAEPLCGPREAARLRDDTEGVDMRPRCDVRSGLHAPMFMY
jgi:hypothetical protein